MPSEEKAERLQPRYDGDTFNTANRRKTGVGNEPEVIDVRERRRAKDEPESGRS